MWWKLADASEASSHTFSWSGGESEEAYGWIMRFTGYNSDNPIDVFALTNGGSSSTSSPSSPAVTTTSDDTLIVRLGAFDDDDISHNSPGLSGHTAITMDESSSGDGTCSGGAGYLAQGTAGGSGTSSFSLTNNEQYVTLTLAIATPCSGSSSEGSGEIITVDAKTTGTVPSYASSGTVSHTTAGDDRLMLVGVSFGFDLGDSVSSVTYNGTSLSLVGKRYHSDKASGMEIWSLVAPDTGTHDVVVNNTGTSHYGAVIGVMTFNGVDQSTPLGSFSSSRGRSTTPSTNVTSATGELVFGVVGVDTQTASANITPGAGQTEHWDFWDGTKALGGGSTEAGAASVVTSWTLSGSWSWSAGGVSIKPK